MKEKLKKILKRKKLLIFVVLFFVLVQFGYAEAAQAGAFDFITNAVTGLPLAVMSMVINIIVWVSGGIITLATDVLMKVAQYNNFSNEALVTEVWIMVRDLCNMFFILMLLIIAFATILRIPSYEMKKTLPKLVIMAVLINFSKTICALVIDFSQVLMLSFVSAFKGGHLIDALGIKQMFTIKQSWDYLTPWGKNNIALFGTEVFGIVLLTIATIVVVAFVAILMVRVITLWVLMMLSPIAFLLMAIPAGQKYASKWWSEFGKTVVVGPVIAFFLWLALVAANTEGGISASFIPEWSEGNSYTSMFTSLFLSAIVGESSADFFRYLIVIIIMLIGLKMAQEAGGAMGDIAGKASTLSKKIGMLPVRGVKEGLSFGADKLHQTTGIDLNLARVWGGLKEKRAEMRSERYSGGMQKAKEAMEGKGRLWGLAAMTGMPGDAWEQITSKKGIRQRFRGGKRMAGIREGLEPGVDKADFMAKYAGMSSEDRMKLAKNLVEKKKLINDERGSGTLSDDRKKELEKEEKEITMKKEAMKEVGSKPLSEDDIKDYREVAEKKKEEFREYVPVYASEARAEEQKVVNNKMTKLKDVNDAEELLPILQDAMKQHDKAMVKAISKKMAQNYDDNEALQPIVGRTDAKGLQLFADKLIKDVGFTTQEAYALGSEISNINKGTNHWAATAAFTMDKGRWRKSSQEESDHFREIEVGKMHPQAIARNFNRLAYGHHDASNTFHLDSGGVKSLRLLDNETGMKNIGTNMTQSTAMHLTSKRALAQLQKLEKAGQISKELIKALQDRARTKIADVNHNQIVEALKAA